jgi:hypothetical protein
MMVAYEDRGIRFQDKALNYKLRDKGEVPHSPDYIKLSVGINNYCSGRKHAFSVSSFKSFSWKEEEIARMCKILRARAIKTVYSAVVISNLIMFEPSVCLNLMIISRCLDIVVEPIV